MSYVTERSVMSWTWHGKTWHAHRRVLCSPAARAEGEGRKAELDGMTGAFARARVENGCLANEIRHWHGDCATEAAGDGRRACIGSGAAWRVCGAVGACVVQWARALASLLGTVGTWGAVVARSVGDRCIGGLRRGAVASCGAAKWPGATMARRGSGLTRRVSRLALGVRRRSAREWSTTVGTGMVDGGRHGNVRRG